MNAAQHLVKLQPDRGRTGRPHHDRARARDRDVPADHRDRRARRSRRGAAGRIRRGRSGRKSAAPEAARRVDGRSRLRLGSAEDANGAAWSRSSSLPCKPASPSFRAAGLNVMMSMKQEGKPVSFIEDCAVPLPHLADYTERLNDIFDKHGTHGTMYAHASEGCLHVRPVLNLKLEKDVKAMRAIAEEAFAMVREYKGSHSGEHGDGHRPLGIPRGDVRRAADARVRGGQAALRSGRCAQSRQDRACAASMDDRSLFRYPPDYRVDRNQDRARLVVLSGRRPAVSRARSRCATTTAPAASSKAA